MGAGTEGSVATEAVGATVAMTVGAALAISGPFEVGTGTLLCSAETSGVAGGAV
jgi:hypothetical protein